MVNGINVTVANFKGAGNKLCEPCIMGKQTRSMFPSSISEKSSTLLNLVHTDVCGPFSVPSAGGCKYFATFLDHSGLSIVRALTEKSDTQAFIIENH